MPSSFCFGEEWLLFTHHLSPSLAELNSSFSYHASSPTLPLKLETEYRKGLSLKAMMTKPPWIEPQVTSSLSQHPLYPFWSRLWTSPQNVDNKLHLSIVTTSSLPSLEQAVDFSTECWQPQVTSPLSQHPL
ncbi:hypothetical protein F2Q69_00049984 [Brassica cretica]|uniref:Uncharacterized protein n=1 Tax=Brassica cretica TaxID=69181 RepID=A0A8S9PFB5_BRACR|nr:hypothetical protein F2Q69_00049984 [Brassica cretica]